jgi:hypothetical protein
MLNICEFCVDQFVSKDLSDGIGEGLLRLWIYTKDLRYRRLGIKVLEHVQFRWMQSDGFSTIDGQPVNVNTIAELIKFLYLLFGSDDLLGTELWVFSKSGHPYPKSLDGVPNNGVSFPCKPSTPEEMTGKPSGQKAEEMAIIDPDYMAYKKVVRRKRQIRIPIMSQ